MSSLMDPPISQEEVLRRFFNERGDPRPNYDIQLALDLAAGNVMKAIWVMNCPLFKLANHDKQLRKRKP